MDEDMTLGEAISRVPDARVQKALTIIADRLIEIERGQEDLSVELRDQHVPNVLESVIPQL